MKIGNFPMVERIVAARRALITDRDQSSLGVTLQGRYQDETMVECVRPAVKAELNRRIADLDKDLLALGVQID